MYGFQVAGTQHVPYPAVFVRNVSAYPEAMLGHPLPMSEVELSSQVRACCWGPSMLLLPQQQSYGSSSRIYAKAGLETDELTPQQRHMIAAGLGPHWRSVHKLRTV
jgi:hypothetical protein